MYFILIIASNSLKNNKYIIYEMERHFLQNIWNVLFTNNDIIIVICTIIPPYTRKSNKGWFSREQSYWDKTELLEIFR